MRVFRVGFRIFKLVSMAYAFWRSSRKTRLAWLGLLLWRMIRRKPLVIRKPKVVFTFVNAEKGHIYHRKGWRKIEGNRVT